MKTIRTHHFFHECHLPTSTAQQRKHGSKGRNWQTPQMKYGSALYQAIFSQHKCEPFSGWLKVEISLMFPHTKKSAKIDMARVPMILKPDFDNAVKIPIDAMVKEGLIKNDAHIYDGRCIKWHSDIEGIDVTIEQHDPDEEAQKAREALK